MLTGPLIFLGQLVGEQTGEREPICGGRQPTNLFGKKCTWSAPARSATPPSIPPSEATGLLHYKLAMNSGTFFPTAFTGVPSPQDSVSETLLKHDQSIASASIPVTKLVLTNLHMTYLHVHQPL